MNEPLPRAELQQAYEALRAQATGQLTTSTPRGLALFLASGLPAWLTVFTTWTAVPASVAAPSPVVAGSSPDLAGLGLELVRVLTEMSLGGQRGSRT